MIRKMSVFFAVFSGMMAIVCQLRPDASEVPWYIIVIGWAAPAFFAALATDWDREKLTPAILADNSDQSSSSGR